MQPTGSPHLGIDHLAGLVTAAVYLDLHDVCPGGADGHGFEVTVTHLEKALARADTQIQPGEPGVGMVVHSILLNEYGTYLIENLSFAALGGGVEPGRYLFMLAPLRISGGTGSPVNPLLIK